MTYLSPTTTPTDPLDGQNGWGTNDATQTGTPGTSTQLVGRSNFVGALTPTAYFTAQNGVLGGVYRTTAGSGPAPDVVPSTTTGGLISLFHAVTIPTTATFVALDVDFAVTTPNAFTNRDTFGFSLSNAAGVSLVSFNFAPSTTPTTRDNISFTTNGTNFTASNQIILNGNYHLALNINTTTGSMVATINNATFAGTVTGARGITQVAATWSVGDRTTVANGGYQNADDNYLVFDNLAVSVPEPSTYAMMALGVAGMVGALRLRRNQA